MAVFRVLRLYTVILDIQLCGWSHLEVVQVPLCLPLELGEKVALLSLSIFMVCFF